jgi:hypothetical protein
VVRTAVVSCGMDSYYFFKEYACIVVIQLGY